MLKQGGGAVIVLLTFFAPFRLSGQFVVEGSCGLVGVPVYGTNGGQISISSLPTPLPPSFVIRGVLSIDQKTEWAGHTVLMSSDAQILIQPDIEFSISACIIQGCGRWKGINMTGDGTFSMTGGRVSDANIALESTGKNSITIDGNAFLTRNYYGIYIRNATELKKLSLSNLTIDGTLPPPPNPLSPTESQITRGIVGIAISNISKFNIAGNGTIKIRKYEFGVQMNESNGNISGVKVEECAWITDKGKIGTAIDMTNGEYSVKTCTIDRCHRGIVSNICKFDISNNITDNTTKAIICSNAWPGAANKCTIFNNTITNTVGGIDASPNPGAYITIDQNTVKKVSRVGIFLTDLLFGGSVFSGHKITNSPEVEISNNAGLFPENNAGATGISVSQVQGLGGGGISVCSNKVTLPSTNTESDNKGILAESIHAVDISKNEITQGTSNATANHTGIRFVGSNFCFLGCNGVNYTNTGIQTSGNCPNVSFHTNRFKEHDKVGLEVSGRLSNFFSGKYEHQGNRWLYITDNIKPGAISNMDPFFNSLYRFVVDKDENMEFFPYVIGANWFFNESTPDITRSCNPSSSGCAGAIAEGSGEDEMMQRVATEDPILQVLPPLLRWELEQQTLNYIAESGNTSSSAWSGFWNSRYNTSQGIIARMQQSSQFWQTSTAELLANFNQKAGALSLLLRDSTATAIHISALQAGRDAAKSAYQNAWTTHLSSLSGLNAAIPSGGAPYEQYLKDVNGISLSLLSGAQTELSEAQLTQLREIAALCYAQAGPASGIARSLLYSEATEWVSEDCSAEDRNRDSQNLSPAKAISLAPNPAKEILVVTVAANDNTRFTLELYDVSGKSVLQRSLSSGQTVIDTKGLLSGFYIARCVDNTGRLISSHKLIIQK